MDAQVVRRRTPRRWPPVLPAIVVFTLALVTILLGAPDVDCQVNFGNDHGRQLSLGRQILLGKRLFVDLFPDYGPLPAYVSAAGLLIHNSLIPETIICAMGYAAAIGLLFAVTQREVGLAPAVAMTLANALLLARFYKWYFWLFQVLTIVLLWRSSIRRGSVFRWSLLGVAGGLAFLFRIDLGVESLALAVGGLLLISFRRRPLREAARCCSIILLGFALPVVTWLITLACNSGTPAVRDYFVSYVDTALGLTHAMSLPTPRLTLDSMWHPTSFHTGSALLFALLPGMAFAGLMVSVYELCRGRRSRRTRFLAVAALGALLFLPQAMHRSETRHLLQVLPPLALCGCLLLSRLWAARGQSSPILLAGRRGLAVALGLLLTLAVYDIRPLWGGDLFGSAERGPWRKFSGLAAELDGAAESPSADTARFLRDHCGPQDSVLPLCFSPNVLFFSRCPAAGILAFYSPGFLTTARWQERNLQRVIADRPKYVLVTEGIPIDGKPENEIPRYLPAIWHYVEREYPAVQWRSGPYVVRGRDAQTAGR
jgi:hypothetical protein